MTDDDISIEDIEASSDSGVAITGTHYDANPRAEERLTLTADLAADHEDEAVTARLEARTTPDAPWQPIRTAPPRLTQDGKAVFKLDPDTLSFLGMLASDIRIRTETADGLPATLDVTLTFLAKTETVIEESVPEWTRPAEPEETR